MRGLRAERSRIYNEQALSLAQREIRDSALCANSSLEMEIHGRKITSLVCQLQIYLCLLNIYHSSLKIEHYISFFCYSIYCKSRVELGTNLKRLNNCEVK